MGMGHRYLELLDEVALEVLKIGLKWHCDNPKAQHFVDINATKRTGAERMADDAYVLATAMVRASLACKTGYKLVKIGDKNET